MLPFRSRRNHAKRLFSLALVSLTSVIALLSSSQAVLSDSTTTAGASQLACQPPAPPARTVPDRATQARSSEAFGKLPLSFEANQGQMDPEGNFLARGNGHTILVTSQGAVLSLQKSQRRTAAMKDPTAAAPPSSPTDPHAPPHNAALMAMQLIGGAPNAPVQGLEELPGKIHYYVGNDPKAWHTHIPIYAQVKYSGVYPGIDLVYYGNQRQLEYDFVVMPGSDPHVITLGFPHAQKIEVDTNGDLVLHLGRDYVRQSKPLIYQDVQGVRQTVAGGYVLHGTHQVQFAVGPYDASRPLIIDPTLTSSTFLGGNGEDPAYGIPRKTKKDAKLAARVRMPRRLQPPVSRDPLCHQCRSSPSLVTLRLVTRG